MMQGKKIHFNGLNELRAIAALCVVFHHLEQYNSQINVINLFGVNGVSYFIINLGKNAVYLFFVLSGFLITYLLLLEKETKNKINIRNFYLRRIFRIWPLYYIILIISFLFIPFIVNVTDFFNTETYYIKLINSVEPYSFKNIIMYFLLLSNVGVVVVGSSQTWSISVEEQFYLIWPNIVNFIKTEILIFILFLFPILLTLYKAYNLPFTKYLIYFPIEIMSVGGFFAYIKYYFNDRIIIIFKNNYLFLLSIFLVLLVLFIKCNLLLRAMVFSILILFIIEDRRVNLRSKLLSRLGLISYGIYMYHPLCMFLSSAINNHLFRSNIVLYKIGFYILTLILTLVISYLSYNYIELKLLKIKDKRFS